MTRPSKLGEAEAFAKTGISPADLHWEAGLKAPVAAASVRALVHLGPSDEALEALATYGVEKRGAVIKELIRAAAHYDAATFAELVLSQTACKKLDLTAVGKPEELCLVAGMAALEELKCGPWNPGVDIALLARCTKLKTLTVDRVNTPQLDGMELLTSLQHLTMYWCLGVEALEPLSALTDLRELHLHSLKQVEDVHPLGSLTQVKVMSLTGTYALRSLDGLETMRALERIHFRANDFDDIGALASLDKVRALELSNVHQLHDLRPLASMPALRKLEICYAHRIEDLTPLAEISTLERLEISCCEGLKDISPLASLTNLRSLSIMGLDHITSLDILRDMKILEELNICHCEALTDLSALQELPQLKSISMSSRFGHPDHPVFQARQDIKLDIY